MFTEQKAFRTTCTRQMKKRRWLMQDWDRSHSKSSDNLPYLLLPDRMLSLLRDNNRTWDWGLHSTVPKFCLGLLHFLCFDGSSKKQKEEAKASLVRGKAFSFCWCSECQNDSLLQNQNQAQKWNEMSGPLLRWKEQSTFGRLKKSRTQSSARTMMLVACNCEAGRRPQHDERTWGCNRKNIWQKCFAAPWLC